MIKAWLQAHGWKVAPPAFLVGIVLGAVLASRHGPPPGPKEHEKETDSTVAAKLTTSSETQSSGPVDTKGTWTVYGPVDAAALPPGVPVPAVPGAPQKPRTVTSGALPTSVPCPVAAVLNFETHSGQVVTEKHETDQIRTAETKKLDLTLTPTLARPNWELQAGAEDVFAAWRFRFAARRRLFELGPCDSVWVEAALTPKFDDLLHSSIGVAVACGVR